MEFKRHLFLAISFLLLTAAIISSVILLDKVQERKQLQVDLAEFRHVRYGLLNPHEWKRKVSEVISNKLDDFDFESLDKEELKAQVIKALERLFEEIEKLLEKRKSKGSFITQILRSSVIDFAIDMEEFKRQIPELADAILEEMDTPEARENIKLFIQEKINSMVEESIGVEDTTPLDHLRSSYNLNTNKECIDHLEESVSNFDKELAIVGGIEITSVILLFLLWFLMHDDTFRNWQWYALFIGVAILLVSGVTTPMINIDARIDKIGIQLLGQELTFRDQILFFQSKSILDVVIILLRNGDFQTIMVGVLILLFSIILPILKMFSLLIIRVSKKMSSNPLLSFMAFKTGKWSMADVFVVAIFMAYIGFRGILNSQLHQLTSASEKAEIIATDNSSLQMGIVFFTAYVILGLLFSHWTKPKDEVWKSTDKGLIA